MHSKLVHMIVLHPSACRYISSNVEDALKAPGLFDAKRPVGKQIMRWLPLYLKNPETLQAELPYTIGAWLEAGGGPIAQLSAPLGQGKTIATCILQQQLQRQYPDQVTIWVRMRWVRDISLTETRLIPSLLGNHTDEYGSSEFSMLPY